MRLMAGHVGVRRGAHILGFQEMPQFAAWARSQGEAQARQRNLPITLQARYEAGCVLLAWQQDGIEMCEVMSAAINYLGIIAGANYVAAYRAPEGRPDPGLLDRVVASQQLDPAWADLQYQRVTDNLTRYYARKRQLMDDHYAHESQQIDLWHQRQMAVINARGMADRQAIRMRTNAEVAGTYNQIAANTSAANGHIQRRTLEGIDEYNTHTGVDGGSVQSSIHGGDRVFQNMADPNQACSTDAPYPNPPAGYTELERQQ